MPPPGGGRFRLGNPSRDYVLLSGGGDEEEAAGPPAQPTAARLFGLAREQRWRIALATLFLGIASVAQLANPKLAGDLIDVAIQAQQQGGGGLDPEEARRRTNAILLAIIGVTVVGAVAGGVRDWLFKGAAERVMFGLRTCLFSRILAQEMGWFDRVRTGELVNRLSEDTRSIKGAATFQLSNGLRAGVVTVLGVAAMLWTSPLLAGIACGIIPVVAACFNVYGRSSRRLMREQLAASAGATTVAEEALSNIRTVRSFAKEGAVEEAYSEVQAKTLAYGLKSAALDGLMMPVTSMISTLSIMGVIWFGSRLVVDGRMTAGQLSSFVVYAVFVSANAGMLMATYSGVMQALGASERVFQLLDRTPQLQRNDGGGGECPCGAAEGGELRLEHVWFAYPSRPQAFVLRGLDLHVAPGEKVALVGPSGGGKSTIVALVERFYDPQRGQVTLDGADLRLVDHAWLHRQVALVSQEPILFADTIANNITFGLGKGGATQEQVEEAARVANALDFVAAFPQGFATMVGERGVRLSGGQKQRIAIARAVICQPRVLLLDEATSALDAESEHLVKEALDRVSEGRTVLVIAHRLSTVREADRVAVVQDGMIAESGHHDELLEADGAYAALVRRQLLSSDTTSARSLHARLEPSNTSSSAVGDDSGH